MSRLQCRHVSKSDSQTKHAELGLSEAGPQLSTLRTGTIGWIHAEGWSQGKRLELIRVQNAVGHRRFAKMRCEEGSLILKPSRIMPKREQDTGGLHTADTLNRPSYRKLGRCKMSDAGSGINCRIKSWPSSDDQARRVAESEKRASKGDKDE